ncbi:MAG TPA: GNAT family N-acetyltransferase [Candidatus Binatia bacterium]|nr:GNAT family N-acetyltransferase [Candidatus Binatia bacterium]
MHEAVTSGSNDPLIREVRSRTDRRAYLALVREPYAANPYWVHPDVRILRNLLRRSTLLAARSEWRALIAEEEGKPVACLTAFVHRSFEEKLGRKIGTIGFFEALGGHTRAVDALFREAEGWLRSRGATRVWGPINGQMMYGFGCLENRYTERPVFGTAYNLADYPGHWWRQEYKHAPSFYSYTIDLTRDDVRGAIERAIANPRIADPPAITLRTADRRAWRREVEIFIDLHNEAFAANWGDTPLSHAEIWELMGPARFTTDPELFWIAEIAGRPVGLVLCMPDLNEAFARTRAEPTSLKAAVALLRFRRRIKRGGLFVIGVLKEARRRGLAGTLAATAMKRMIARRMTAMEYCLVLEDNLPSQRIARRFGAEQTKTYLMFEKAL